MTYQLVMTDHYTSEMEEAVRAPLLAYNNTRFGESEKQELAISLQDEAGKTTGGLIGWTARGWLYVQLLYIPEENRGHGLAGRLLTMAENEAKKRHCIGSYIDTMSPDALQAYLKYGYKIIGKHGPFTGGHYMHWLSKTF